MQQIIPAFKPCEHGYKYIDLTAIRFQNFNTKCLKCGKRWVN
jgi:hypothetical protein